MDWKNVERQIANLLNTERNSKKNLGEATADIVKKLTLKPETKEFSIEIKARSKIPQYIKDMLAQARVNAKENQVPIVFLKEKGKRYTSTIVMLDLHQFLNFFDKDF